MKKAALLLLLLAAVFVIVKAKTAPKDTIVMGLVSVRKNVEAYMPAYRFLLIRKRLLRSGFAKSVLIPIKQRRLPPTSLNKT